MKKRLLLFCLSLVIGLYGANDTSNKLEGGAKGSDELEKVFNWTHKELVFFDGLEKVPGVKAFETINLSHNKIVRIPLGLFVAQYAALKKLYIQSNNISEVKSETFTGLSQLEILSLSHNKIKKVEEDAFIGLDNLTELHLECNKLDGIATIPYAPVGKSLKRFVVYGNPIPEIFFTFISGTLPNAIVERKDPFFNRS